MPWAGMSWDSMVGEPTEAAGQLTLRESVPGPVRGATVMLTAWVAPVITFTDACSVSDDRPACVSPIHPDHPIPERKPADCERSPWRAPGELRPTGSLSRDGEARDGHVDAGHEGFCLRRVDLDGEGAHLQPGRRAGGEGQDECSEDSRCPDSGGYGTVEAAHVTCEMVLAAPALLPSAVKAVTSSR